MDRIIITGSGGLVGNAAVRYFSPLVKTIVGVDNNSRGRWFGEAGSVKKSIDETFQVANYKHLGIDVRNVEAVDNLVKCYEPDAIIHCAGQPSHEKSAEIPFEDFQINTVGTVNFLEAVRKYAPNCSFVFTSTNKVYGDNPNQLPISELPTRYNAPMVDESMSLDRCMHSPFGANKAAADLITQEYGRYYGLNTVCFRCGCITGKNHQGVEQHGFLSYLCKVAKSGGIYTIYGHQGKQVRDNIHADDLITAFHAYLLNPSPGAVYNIGGGFENSCSILEALQIIKNLTGITTPVKFDQPRKGDHICYLTNNARFRCHYPTWDFQHPLGKIFHNLLLN